MNSPSCNASGEATRCPLCGGPNDCQRCTRAEGPCWCASVTIPDALLRRVPAELRQRACICRKCVESFHAECASRATPTTPPQHP